MLLQLPPSLTICNFSKGNFSYLGVNSFTLTAKLIQVDAEKLDFLDNSFDNVLCGLSTSFFSNSLSAIDEMYRGLKDEGRLGLSTWKKREKKGVLDKVYTKLFHQNQDSNLNNITGRPDFGSVDGIEKFLKNVGLKNIEIFVEEKTFYYKDEEEWWQEQWTNLKRQRLLRLWNIRMLMVYDLMQRSYLVLDINKALNCNNKKL